MPGGKCWVVMVAKSLRPWNIIPASIRFTVYAYSFAISWSAFWLYIFFKQGICKPAMANQDSSSLASFFIKIAIARMNNDSCRASWLYARWRNQRSTSWRWGTGPVVGMPVIGKDRDISNNRGGTWSMDRSTRARDRNPMWVDGRGI